MDQKNLLTIFLLFLLSSQLWTIIWDVGRAAFYIIIILLVLTYVNPESAETLRDIFRRIINFDTTLVTNGLSYVSAFILALFNKVDIDKVFPKTSKTEKMLTQQQIDYTGSPIQEDNVEDKQIIQETPKEEVKSNTIGSIKTAVSAITSFIIPKTNTDAKVKTTSASKSPTSVIKSTSKSISKSPTRSTSKSPTRSIPKSPSRSTPKSPSRSPSRSTPKSKPKITPKRK